ncbi:MAG: flagellin [Vicinamibacterales bacterium]
MSRINTNVSSLIAQRVLRRNNDSLNTSLERLSTGLKINSGKDNPAGLIASENLRAEKAGISQAIDNAERAANIIGTAEGGLSEISSLLTEVQTLVGQAANSGGLSPEELEANQLQVDSILGTINRIAGSVAFQGTKLLNGNYAYSTSSVATSAFDSLQINAARTPDGAKVNVIVQVLNSATIGKVSFTDAGGDIQSAVTLTVAGNLGTEQLSFASGTNLSAIAAGINAITEVTGVTASANAGGNLSFSSTGFGADAFVSVAADKAFFAVAGGTSGKDFGTDADVTVNGAVAQADGKAITYRTSNLDIEFDLSDGLNGGQSKTFAITGGGATFALGSKVTEADKASIGIQNVSTGSLGDGTIGTLSDLASGKDKSLESGNLVAAQRVLDKAIKQVSQLRGRLGAFQKFTIGSTVNSLGVAFENASAAESAIRDTDFAQETANLTRSQILAQAATTVLAQANASPQAALSLLR